MHKPWLYHITGISGYQVAAQRVERHGRSREIRNAHVLARCGVLEVEDLRFLLDKPPCVALALLGIILKETAAYASCDKEPSRNRKRKTGMSDLTLILVIESKQSRDEGLTCKGCRETGIVPRKGDVRRIRVHDVGRMRCYVEVPVRRMRCPKCGRRFKEKLPFVTSPRARVSRAFEWLIVSERANASITAVAEKLGVDWRAVKDAEKRVLSAEYKTIDLKGVTRIGIDELYVFGNERKSRKYITVVRDLDSGRVLNVSRGKGEAALKEFAYRLRKQKVIDRIRCVCMDMSNAYYAWVGHNLRKDTLIVFDHFHVVMKMNEHINNIRRMAMARVNSDTRKRLADLAASDRDRETIKRIMSNAKVNQDRAKKYLKGNMKLLLMNSEDIAEHPKAKARLDRMLAKYADINAAYLLKEKLRSIYANAKTKIDAAGLFADWIREAQATEVDDLVAMASTIEEHLAGILGFWEFRGASNASVEGFNNKIRWLIKQAYGYHDFKYFKLKIFDLPNLKSRDGDC